MTPERTAPTAYGGHTSPRTGWWKAQPLKVKLPAIILVLLVLGITVFGGGTILLLRTFLVDQVDKQLAGFAPQVSSFVDQELGAQVLDGSGLSRPQHRNGGLTLPENFAVLVTYDGTSSLSTWADTDDQPVLPPVDDATDRRLNGKPYTVTSQDGRTRWRVVSGTTQSGLATFSVAASLASVNQTLANMQRVLALSAVGIVLLGTAGGYVLVRRSLRPLRDVESTAAAIAGGDLSRRVPPLPGSTEVGQLSGSLNTMLGQIESAFDARVANEAKMRQFVSDASHELRTPLSAIRGYGELYRMGALQDSEAVANAMGRIESEARRMGSLVQDLLQLTRLDEGRALRRERVDLTQLALDGAADLRALDPTRQVRIIALHGAAEPVPRPPAGTRGPVPPPPADGAQDSGDLLSSAQDPAPLEVTADADRLRQVVANLVGNAARYTPQGSPVEIAVGTRQTPTGPAAVLEVRDHGPGIAPEMTRKVFERFFRLDSSRARTSGGSGLGLAIVSSIAEAHGGSVHVEPTPGGGATFQMALPLSGIRPVGTETNVRQAEAPRPVTV